MTTEPRGARILIVDDDPGILRAVARSWGAAITLSRRRRERRRSRKHERSDPTWRSSTSGFRP